MVCCRLAGAEHRWPGLSRQSNSFTTEPNAEECTGQFETINHSSNKLDFDGVDPDVGMHLLTLYWSQQYYSGLVVYRPVFMRDMACGGPFFSKLLLNAMYFSISKTSSRLEIRQNPGDIDTSGLAYRHRFKELLSTAFDESRITTIQALLIMSSSLFTRCDERSLSWLYAGHAFNMIIDLGIHVDEPELTILSPEEGEHVEVRRRVFWGAYGMCVQFAAAGILMTTHSPVLDKIQALYQGRPPHLREPDSHVSLTFLEELEELEPFNPISYATPGTTGSFPSYGISAFKAICKLAIVMDRILTTLYAVKSLTRSPGDVYEEIKSLHRGLERWHSGLPPTLKIDYSENLRVQAPPHALSLLCVLFSSDKSITVTDRVIGRYTTPLLYCFTGHFFQTITFHLHFQIRCQHHLRSVHQLPPR